MRTSSATTLRFLAGLVALWPLVAPHGSVIAARERVIEERADGIVWRVSAPAIGSRAVRAAIDDSTRARARLEYLFDSLGYFAPQWDTGSAGVIRVIAGERTRVGSLDATIDGADTAIADSIRASVVRAYHCPRPYDAGEIAEAGHAAVRAAACAGFPFASVALAVARCSGDSSDSCVRIHLRVTPGTRHCFAQPVLLAGHATRARQLFKDIAVRGARPYDIRDIERTRARLLSREYVDSVEILAPGVVIDSIATDSLCGPERVAVPIRVVDRRGAAVDGGVTLASDGAGGVALSGSLTALLVNALGIGDRAEVRYRGDTASQHLQVEIGKMHLWDLPLYVSGRFGLDIASDSFSLFEGGAGVRYELGGRWRLGVAGSATDVSGDDSGGVRGSWRVYGGEFTIERPPERAGRGVMARELSIATGIDAAQRGERTFTRYRLEFSAGAHVPVARRLGLAGRLVSRSVFTDEPDLTSAEMYRVGGSTSLRGYPDGAYAFRTAAILQSEYRVYLGARTAAYVFLDGGAGSVRGIEHSNQWRGLFGYGLGIRLPVRIGTATVEWGRSIDDTRGLGRIHARFASRLADNSW